MMAWAVAAHVLALALLVAAVGTLRGSLGRRIVALQMGGLVTTLLFLVFAALTQRAFLIDLALALVLVSSAASFAAAHFLERWL